MVRAQRLARFAASFLVAVLTLGLAPLATVAASAPEEAAADAPRASADLLERDFAELLDIEVTTAAKKQESWFRTAAAVAVLTSEDLRRSGVETIPDALRLLPGVEVARIDANKWAVSARGSNSRFANKLLVLVDGRSVYTPLFSGVYWDAQDLLLDDVERIEVIRGPGASLWGSNAVNGVINVITKDSQDTQRLLGRAASGASERAFGGLRYGGRLGANATYRTYASGFQRDALDDPGRAVTDRGWEGQRAGFRLDWNPRLRDELTMVGHVHSALAEQILSVPTLALPYRETVRDRVTMRGLDVLGRWVHRTASGDELTLQSSLDLSDRDEYIGHEKRATVDLDAQHRLRWRPSQETVWGFNCRLSADELRAIHVVRITEPRQTDHLLGVFAQHEAQAGDAWSFVLGSKFEASRYGRPSLQPNVRASFHPSESQTFWGACSRALRTTSRGERSGTLRVAVFPDTLSGLPVALTYLPGDAGRRESVVAYELGYRMHPAASVMFDVSAYHNDYRDLTFVVPGTPEPAMDGSTPYLRMPLYQVNTANATGDGVESSLRVAVSPRWQLRATHTWAQLEVEDAASGGTTITSAALPPRHSGSIQSLLQLPHRVELDVKFSVVGALPGTSVPGYEEASVRLGWQPVPGLELAVAGENLLHESHLEFAPDVFFAPSAVERGVRASLRWLR